MSEAFPVPISKAGRNIPIPKDELEAMFDQHPEIYKAVIAEGLKVFLNKGMTAIKGMRDMDEEELAEARDNAFEVAIKNWENLKQGNLKLRKNAAGGAKVSREEATFLNNKAKALIKAAYKQAGKKLPAKASAITQAAKDYIADEDNADWVAEARKEFAALKAQTKPIEVAALSGKLKSLLDSAENVKPKVPPKRKAKEPDETVDKALVAAAKGKQAKGKQAEARH